MSNGDLHWIANYIWGIADDVLRDLYVRGKYRDVILPMTVLRRLDAVLEDSKRNVLEMKTVLDQAGVIEQDRALRQAAGQAFYNTSRGGGRRGSHEVQAYEFWRCESTAIGSAGGCAPWTCGRPA